jgi:cyclophilin family peptidyl-prolyl cis-trans isomerase
MKRICTFLTVMLVLLAGCKGNKAQDPATEDPASTEEQTETTQEELAMNEAPASPADKWAELGEEPMLKIKTTDGTMTVKLYADTPLHRDNFVKLAKKGFYNGILFHRIIKGFMIQGGDPLTKDSSQVAMFGTGGPGYTIPAEIVPGKTHKKGALAAARRGDQANPAKESSGSQFYIVQDADGCRHLDGEYTIFGEVVDGLGVIDKIASERTDMRDRPLNKVEIISITPVEK